MSEEPIIFDRRPVSVNLEPGTYYYCRCGRSAKQPFCDGAHAGTSFVPKKFVVEDRQSVYLCNCKHTANAPFCDGTHRRLPVES